MAVIHKRLSVIEIIESIAKPCVLPLYVQFSVTYFSELFSFNSHYTAKKMEAQSEKIV